MSLTNVRALVPRDLLDHYGPRLRLPKLAENGHQLPPVEPHDEEPHRVEEDPEDDVNPEQLGPRVEVRDDGDVEAVVHEPRLLVARRRVEDVDGHRDAEADDGEDEHEEDEVLLEEEVLDGVLPAALADLGQAQHEDPLDPRQVAFAFNPFARCKYRVSSGKDDKRKKKTVWMLPSFNPTLI